MECWEYNGKYSDPCNTGSSHGYLLVTMCSTPGTFQLNVPCSPGQLQLGNSTTLECTVSVPGAAPPLLLLYSRAGIFKESMGARNRGGIGLSYRPARLHRLAEFVPWNRFLGSMNV